LLGDQTSSKGCVATGHHGVNCSQHLRPIGLPPNPMECGFIELCQAMKQSPKKP
jgi:hypothetical protein